MILKSFELSCGQGIEVYQKVFTSNELEHFASFAIKSHYSFGGHSSITTELSKLGSFFSCPFSENDEENFGFNKNVNIKEITKNLQRTRSWINATTPGSWIHPHVDSPNETVTILFAVNITWNTDHGGETLFYNSFGEKEIAIDFIPGQIIKFDGRVLHKPGLTYGHFEPRYMYTCQYRIS